MAIYKQQRRLARKESGLRQAKLKSDYDAYLEQLATQYGLSTKDLNSNLEARGILNSGEAGTARTTAAAKNEAAGTTAKSNFDYNTGIEAINLTKQLATLQSGKATPATTAPKDTVPTYDLSKVNWDDVGRIGQKPVAVAPTNIGGGKTYSNTGVYGAVYPATSAPTAKKVTIKPIGARFR